MGDRTTDIHSNKMYLDRPHTLHKINSAWIINLNVKCKTIKHLENDIGENSDDLEYKQWPFRYYLKGMSHERSN